MRRRINLSSISPEIRGCLRLCWRDHNTVLATKPVLRRSPLVLIDQTEAKEITALRGFMYLLCIQTVRINRTSSVLLGDFGGRRLNPHSRKTGARQIARSMYLQKTSLFPERRSVLVCVLFELLAASSYQSICRQQEEW